MINIILRKSGMSLLMMMIIGVIGAIIMVGMIRMSATLFKSNRHAEVQADEIALRASLFELIDCDQTWTANAINPAVDCLPATTVKPLLLKNRSGGNITAPLRPVSGAFDYEADNFDGGGELGNWSLRAYCDQTNQTIVVRAAKPGAGGGFFKDPLSQKQMDWKVRSGNPIIGTAGKTYCGFKFGGACTGPVRVQSGANVLASQCSATTNGDGTCTGFNYVDVVFPTPFNCAPAITVSPTRICDASVACAQGTNDMIRIEALNVTNAGFRMVCTGSPTNFFCGTNHVHACNGRCTWTAIGN